jgi:hypothetical protein
MTVKGSHIGMGVSRNGGISGRGGRVIHGLKTDRFGKGQWEGASQFCKLMGNFTQAGKLAKLYPNLYRVHFFLRGDSNSP